MKRYHKGAAIGPKQVTKQARVDYRTPARGTGKPPIQAEAYALASQNKRKSWARRWLRAHREYLYKNGLIEISL